MDKARFQQLLRRTFWVPFGIAAILGAVLLLELQLLMNRTHWVQHTDDVITLSQTLYRAQIDQEAGLRAYLLTRDKRFLEPFYDGRQKASQLEPPLAKLVSDNSQQQVLNNKAGDAFREWSKWADQALAMAGSGGAVDQAFQLQGKELMDDYRARRRDFIEHEERLRAERLLRSQRTDALVSASMIALCALLAAALGTFGRRQLITISWAFNTALDAAEASAADAQKQKDWLHTTLVSIGDGVISTDAGGNITFINPVAEGLTGWNWHDAKGKPLAEVFRIVNEKTREAVENPMDNVKRSNRVVGLANHTVLIGRKGQEFAIDDSGAPIFARDGKLAGVVLVFRDVTQQRTLEAAVRTNERLALAGRLSASIAHEIHNPLDTVGNLLFLLQAKTTGQSDLQQLISTAQREIHRVAQTSKSMLSLHRESSSPVPVKLDQLLEETASLIEETIAKGRRKIQVENRFRGEIEGFPAELRQVFTNIIKNAVEATSEGGEILIASRSCEGLGADCVLVEVTDDGAGIPEQMAEKLFSPFATTKQEGGTGLGLWVSRSIVEKHGGAIQLINRQDGKPGATARVLLPLKTPEVGRSTQSAQRDST